MEIQELYQVFLRCRQVSTDSRNVAPGSLFLALRGDNFDGNKFAAAALEAGAAFAIVDNPDVVTDDRYILTENTLATLQELAGFHRKTFQFPVLAITGSNGKTTTKELVASVLSRKYRTGVTKGNLNNHIGVPLTLLSMDQNTQFGAVEMGANHPGEIAQLCRIACPDFGLITNIGKAHLEGFGSIEGVIKAKTELYRFLESSGGTIFYNSDNELLSGLAKNISRKISYGTSENCFQRAVMLNSVPFVSIEAGFGDRSFEINSQLTGSYNFENIVAATCIGHYFEVEPVDIKAAIESYLPKNSRSQIIEKGTNKIIMDAYNANPSSMIASISNILGYPDKNKVLILGDMLELGEYSLEEHQYIVEFLRDKGFEKVILVGQLFGSAYLPNNYISLPDVSGLEDYLTNNPLSDCLILLKGSRGIRLEKALPLI